MTGIGKIPNVTFFSAPWKSGAGWFNRELAQAIAGQGMQVTFISPLAEPLSREVPFPGLKRLIIPGGPSRAGGFFYKAKRAALKLMTALAFITRQRRHARTVIYSFYDWIALCVLHFFYIKSLGYKLIYVVHDVTPHGYSFPNALRWMEAALIGLSYRLPDNLIVLTNAAKKELVDKYCISEDRIEVIPHGAFAHGKPTPAPDNGEVILFGSLRRNKSIKEAIQAFLTFGHKFPALRLTIAGAVHSEDARYWRECESLIPPGACNVRTEIGFAEEARLDALLAGAAATLLAYEGFNSQSGAAVLACFSERVIIGTRAGGIGELAANGLQLVTVPSPVSVEGIADALETFANLPLNRRRAMARQSREDLTKYLSWEQIGAEYVRVISKFQS